MTDRRARVESLRARQRIVERRERRTVVAIVTAWVIYALLFLGFWAGVIYVALHFIAKYW